MKIDMVLAELYEHENQLFFELLRISEQHKANHEVHHVARDVATWSRRHLRRIADHAPNYGVNAEPEPQEEFESPRQTGEASGADSGRQGEPGVLLLRDLRKAHLLAAEVSLDWVLLGQAAQGIKDIDLLNLTKECHPGTLRQMRWTTAMLKQNGTQTLVS